MWKNQPKEIFNQIEFYVIRLLLLALLLIVTYRILDGEIHISRFISNVTKVR